MTNDQILSLAKAHYAGDGERWKSALLQIAAGIKSERYQAELQRMAYSQLAQLSRNASERLTTLAPRNMATLVLAESVAGPIREICDEHRARSALVDAGLWPRSRVLLWGPPGNGKTALAAAVATELGIPGYCLSLASTVESWMGHTGRNVCDAWEVTRTESVLLLDEMDAIGGHRGSAEGSSGREHNLIVATLLKLLDEPTQGLIIAATNRVDILDAALRRRFDLELEIEAPSSGEMMTLARLLGERYSVEPRIDGAVSFDGVEKLMMAAARRRVLGVK